MKTNKQLLRKLIVVVLLFGITVGLGSYVKIVRAAATITVNSVADDASDDGDCTLREAITAANSDTASGATLGECIAGNGTDTIQFGIAGSGLKTISLGSALPDITTPMSIDGYTQTGASENTNPAPQGVNTVLTVALDGSGCGISPCDMEIKNTSGVTIRGLSLHSFFVNLGGAFSITNSTNVLIAGNFAGVTPAGAAAGNGLAGIHVGPGSSNITLGGSTPGSRNVVSSNGITNSDVDNILITDDSTNTVNNVTIKGNIIGLNPAGTAVFNNPSMGIRVKNGVNAVTVGGSLATDGNLIAGFDSTGIGIIHEDDGTNGIAIEGVEVRNNVIGYAADGTTNLMTAGTNSGVAVLVLDPTIPAGSDMTNIDITDNKISGTGLFGGIGIGNASASVVYSDISVQRNELNGQGFAFQSGILVTGNVQDVFAAATSPTDSNSITGYASGIQIYTLGVPPASIAAFGNNVTNSTNHGIDLCADTGFDFQCDSGVGPTANDAGDSDSGPNGYINTPVLNSASQVGDQLTVNFDLDAADAPGDSYRVDFYLNDTADGSGFGEGQTYLGGATTSNGSGEEVTLTIDDSINIENGVLTATTTAVNNTMSSGFGATSEFSAVLSDSITFEPAPEVVTPAQPAASQPAAAAAASGNLGETGQSLPQILLVVVFVLSIAALAYLRKRTSH